MATIPATIGQHKINIKTGIIDSDYRLLLPKSAMKKVQIQINFDKDTLEFLGEVSLNTNSSYCLQITSPMQLTTKFSANSCKHHITLRVTDSESNYDVAIKLHCSFPDVSVDKLSQLINNADPKWSNNEELKTEIVCKICKKHHQDQLAHFDWPVYSNKIL